MEDNHVIIYSILFAILFFVLMPLTFAVGYVKGKDDWGKYISQYCYCQCE